MNASTGSHNYCHGWREFVVRRSEERCAEALDRKTDLWRRRRRWRKWQNRQIWVVPKCCYCCCQLLLFVAGGSDEYELAVAQQFVAGDLLHLSGCWDLGNLHRLKGGKFWHCIFMVIWWVLALVSQSTYFVCDEKVSNPFHVTYSTVRNV